MAGQTGRLEHLPQELRNRGEICQSVRGQIADTAVRELAEKDILL